MTGVQTCALPISEEAPEDSNTTGEFEYLFSEPGEHFIIVRAYASSGRYAKAQRTVTIGEEEPVSIEDGYFSPTSYDGMEMVWNDEFDGSAVNTEFWSFETGAGGWGNNELQYYRKENASVNGGTLIIEARKETYQGSNYTSARMVTRNKKSFKYGKVREYGLRSGCWATTSSQLDGQPVVNWILWK